MSDLTIQASLNSGEWSPKLFARVDLAKYKSGAALLENFFVDYRGGASTRTGTKYILQAYKSATAVRLITFQASFDVGYVLEFGDLYIRFYFEGAPVLEAAKVLTSTTAGPPQVFNSAGHGYSVGNWLFIANKYYIVATVPTANSFTLTDLFGNAINTDVFGAYPTNSFRVYTLTSPYAAADLALIKFAQNVSQMVLVHPSYAPQVLTLVTATNWTIGAITFGTTILGPNPINGATTLAAGAVNYAYQVTSVDSNGQESIPAALGQIVGAQDIRAVPGSNTLTWAAIAGAISYNVYRAEIIYGAGAPLGAAYGFIGFATGTTFVDSNIAADFSQTPPVAKNPFAAGNNPSVAGFFQQRLVLAASTTMPQTFWMSQTGRPFNFNVSQIAQSDDAITGTLVSGQLNTIRAMIGQPSGLLMFTDRNSWLINGGSNQSAVTPSAIVANPQSYNGVHDVPLIPANFDILYVQAKGSIIRDSVYNIYSNVYTGSDISTLASHLFYGYQIEEWAWAEEPYKLAWVVRNDGVMLTLTFLKEQEFIGWAHSTTDGLFKSVTTVVETTATEGEADVVYTVVQRTINGQTLKYIERFSQRVYANGAEDAWCVDCGIAYTGAATTSFTGGEFLAGETVTGLADGLVITPFVMPTNGNFTIPTAASKVVVGLAYTAKLQTLPLDLGDPTIQGKVKKINDVTVRVAETLGLKIGGEFTNLTVMKDLVVGNVSSTLTGQNSQRVTDLVDGNARTILDPRFTVPGQYCIQQDLPFPATVLGLISSYTVGDPGNARR
jgi:hypothetical protein